MKKILIALAVLTQCVWAQGPVAPYYPAQGGATLPTATGAGQVLTSTGAGNTYTAQNPNSSGTSKIILPGTPNAVYSFVATGDQACTGGGTLTDLSGSSNNGTISATPPVCNGAGYDFSSVAASYVQLPTAVNSDQTWCAAVYLPYWNSLTSPPGVQNIYLMGSTNASTGWLWKGADGNDLGSWLQATAFQGIGVEAEAATGEAGFHVMCVVVNNAGDQFFIDGQQQGTKVQGSHTTQTSGNLLIGNALGTSGWNTDAQYYYVAGWVAQLSPAQIYSASNAMAQNVALRGVAITPPTTVAGTGHLLYVGGDSIASGYGASTIWSSNLSVNAAYGTVVNGGIYSTAYTATSALGLAGTARWRDTPACQQQGITPLLIDASAGRNDVLSYGYTAAKAYASLLAYVNVARAAGCQVFLTTAISNNGGDASLKDAINPLIRAGSAQFGYSVIDFASSVGLGADGAYANPTAACSGAANCFQADGIHPTNAGQITMGAIASNAINAFGYGAASVSNPTQYTGTVSMVSADLFVTGKPTGAATYTLPDCLGVTGAVYQIFNASSGANTITVAGLASEAITGSTTIAQNAIGRFQATLISQAAGGCGWYRVQ